MPLRPHYLAAMSAAIVGTPDAARPAGPVTVRYESGHRQVIEAATAHRLARGQGGVVAVEADAHTGYSLYAGTACHPTLVLRSDRGGTRFDIPVRAGTIRFTDTTDHFRGRTAGHGRG